MPMKTVLRQTPFIQSKRSSFIFGNVDPFERIHPRPAKRGTKFFQGDRVRRNSLPQLFGHGPELFIELFTEEGRPGQAQPFHQIKARVKPLDPSLAPAWERSGPKYIIGLKKVPGNYDDQGATGRSPLRQDITNRTYRIQHHYEVGVQKVPGSETNAPRSSGNLFFLQTTSHKPLTTTECKKHFCTRLHYRNDLIQSHNFQTVSEASVSGTVSETSCVLSKKRIIYTHA
jgi:hypothetical protein